MNALLKKEIRLLLPSFLIGCVLTFSSWFLLWEHHDAFGGFLSLLQFAVCPAVVVMIALDSFGGEMSSGTFSNLLSQPISRLKIWETKISLLAVALLVIGALWFGSVFCVHVFFSNNIPGDSTGLYDLFVIAVMFGLAIFSGGLWTVLLLRQVAAAFWFTLLVPGVVLAVLAGLFADQSTEFFTGIIVSVIGAYSLAGFFFARWLFFRAQDVQWSGGTIIMPEIRGLARFKSAVALRLWRPRAALWRKEFMLHQSQFVMAFVLFMLHLGVLCVRHFYDLSHSRDLKFTLEVFWVLWFVMPLLVGCAAVAEERKLGTLESQLCLPVKRRTQFAIKFFVVLFLSLLLGMAMPLLLEGIKILPDVHFDLGSQNPGWQSAMSPAQFDFWIALEIFSGFLPLLTFAGLALLISGVAFYASSLARNTLQSLAPAVLGIVLMAFLLVGAAMPWGRELEFLWRGPLAYFIAVPLVLLTLVALAYWNFQQVKASVQMGWRNLFAFLLAVLLGMTTTAVVYHRTWEKLTPFEPAHGAARLSMFNTATRLDAQWGEISVRLPSGKIWMGFFKPTLNPLKLMLGNLKISLADGQFISDSNWMTVKRSGREFVGLKTDGSLWVSEAPQRKTKLGNGDWQMSEQKSKNLVQFGSETNWSSFVPAGLSVLLVKKDGSLWRWGATTNFDFKHNLWPGLRAFTPQRLGTESNWAEIYGNQGYSDQMFIRKTDGSFWTWANSWNTNGQTLLPLEPKFMLQSVKNLGRDRFQSVTEVSHGLQFRVGVRNDGTFRIWADERVEHYSPRGYGNYEWFPTDLQIGDGTNWLAVCGSGEKIITLKKDGTLWLWNFHRSHSWEMPGDQYRFEPEILKTVPVRLGTHSDWIAISGGWGNVNALAADGSLWFWPLENRFLMSDGHGYFGYDFDNDGKLLPPLLDISHKPQPLGNIFSKSN